MASNSSAKILIGRFSPFHFGHAAVLKQALKTSKLVIMLIGSSGLARSIKNPFTFEERRAMIEAWKSQYGVQGDLVILPLHDHPNNDTGWIGEVQWKVKKALTEYCVFNDTIITDIHLTGCQRDHSTWYLNAFPQWKQDLREKHAVPSLSDLSATAVRKLLFTKLNVAELNKYVPQTTLSFLTDFQQEPEYQLLKQEYEANEIYKKSWEAAPYAPTFVTTDAVVIQSGHVLVVERGAFPGKGLWALPGGFLNQHERLLDGAIRELIEETGIRLADGKKGLELTKTILKSSVKDKEIFDQPDRSSRGRTITTAFLFRLDDTKPLPNVKGQNAPLHETGGVAEVETAKAFWLPISRALHETSMWFEDHCSIVAHFVGQDSNH